MAVKKGYKQTEVGVIPEDWQTTSAYDVCDRIMVGIVVKPTQYYRPFGVPVFRSANIRENRIVLDELVFISEEANKLLSKSQVKCGDVLTVRTGYPGTSAVACANHEGFNCVDILISRLSKRVNSSFFSRWVNSPFGKEQILKKQAGLAQKHFNVGDMKELLLVFPTLAEQEAIAGALSDADAWIESLEQLIAKKRLIKQGAMQELLTGKRRLPGFSGEWEKITLGNLGRWMGGMTPSMANANYWDGGDFPWVSSGDVKSTRLIETSQQITHTAIKEAATTVMPRGSVIIVNRSGILRRYLPVSLLLRDMAINQDIKGVILKPGLSSEFVLYALLSVGPTILSTCLKSGTTVESIELMWLKRFAISIPDLAEQAAIATVLSDMDAEIESLEVQLAKAREIKQGMMQELLTGRIRLVR